MADSRRGRSDVQCRRGPPEFADVGRARPANAVLRMELHYINTTDQPLLREAWMNVY